MYRCGTEMERLTLSEIGRPLRSGCCQRPTAGVLTLTGTKQSLEPESRAGSSHRYRRYRGRRTRGDGNVASTTASLQLELTVPTLSRHLRHRIRRREAASQTKATRPKVVPRRSAHIARRPSVRMFRGPRLSQLGLDSSLHASRPGDWRSSQHKCDCQQGIAHRFTQQQGNERPRALHHG